MKYFSWPFFHDDKIHQFEFPTLGSNMNLDINLRYSIVVKLQQSCLIFEDIFMI